MYVWKLFCVSEDGWVYTSSVNAPTICPNNKSHTINMYSPEKITGTQDTIDTEKTIIPIQNNNTTENIYDINNAIYMAMNIKVVFDIKCFHEMSKLRNIIDVRANSLIESGKQFKSEIKLRIERRNDYVSVSTAERGQYVSGYRCEAGMGIRIAQPLKMGQIVKFGYYDRYNGYYYKFDGPNMYVCILNNGIETAIHSTSFNANQPTDLDYTSGNIYKINFSWYGYGNVIFGLHKLDVNLLTHKFFPYHSYSPKNSTTTSNPNLPITVEMDNTYNDTASEVFIAGRKFSIIGNPELSYRKTIYSTEIQPGITNLTTVINMAKKNIMISCKCILDNIKIITQEPMVLQIKTDTNIREDFDCNPCVSESAIVYNTIQTIQKEGIIYWAEEIPAGTTILDLSNNKILFIETQILSILLSKTTKPVKIQITILEDW